MCHSVPPKAVRSWEKMHTTGWLESFCFLIAVVFLNCSFPHNCSWSTSPGACWWWGLILAESWQKEMKRSVARKSQIQHFPNTGFSDSCLLHFHLWKGFSVSHIYPITQQHPASTQRKFIRLLALNTKHISSNIIISYHRISEELIKREVHQYHRTLQLQ